jgi:hypothetical protein
MGDVDAALRAGAAVYNAGFHHAAHDAWEDEWLSLPEGSDDERLLHGLIQFTAAVHHGNEGNWGAVESLAESAGEYLAPLPADYRGVALEAVRAALASMAADPRLLEREGPPPLVVDGDAVDLSALDAAAALAAAVPLAEGLGADEDVLAAAVAFARADLAAGAADSRFVRFVLDFVREGARRRVVVQRLREHVSRRRARERDVDGLF